MISLNYSPFLLLITVTFALIPYSLPNHDIPETPSLLSAPKSPQTPPHYPILSPRQSISFPVQQQNKSRFFRLQTDSVRDGLNGTLLVDYLGYWFTNITIGSGQTQQVHAILDTGSSDFWALNPSLPSNTTSNLLTYNPNTSSSASIFSNEKFNISYGEGGNGVAGPVYFDAVTLGSFTVPNQAIGSATYDQGFFLGEVGSGIFGLGFQRGNSIRPDRQPTFMELLQDSLPSPIMTADFRLDGSGTWGFGSLDGEAFEGELVGVGIRNGTGDRYPGSWSVENVTYAAGGKELGVFDIVFDTGGPQSTGNNETVYAYYDMVPGAVDIMGDGKGWNVPCNAAMPDLEMRFANTNASLVIPGKTFLQVDIGNGTCQSWFVVENSPVRGLPGNAFFMSHYVVYNQAEPSVSWAPKKIQ